MKQKKVLGVFTLAMINVAAITSLRVLPTTAEFGLAAIFFFLAAAVVYFLPVAFVSAELATGWPSRGGVYTWVKQAFGGRWGFLAIWLQWAQNIFFYPVVLSFVAATVAYIINPALAQNKIYLVCVIVGVYWFFTLVNFFGMKISGLISTICALVGTIFPAFCIICLAIYWALHGHTLQFQISWQTAFPNMRHLSNIVFFVGVILSLAGMEMSAVHANEVKNPQKDYPRAIFIAVIIILLMFILGSLAISAVVPQANISLVAGVMEAFSDFLTGYHLTFLIPVIAILITLGAMGQVSTWIVGPSKGLMWTAHDGDIPPIFGYLNKHQMPVVILTVQGCIVSILALMFLLMPTVSSSYWILTALTVQMYLLMYLLLFGASIYLRYKCPKVRRPYKVPFGNFGIWVIAGIGIIGSLFSLVIGFIPPAQLDTGSIFDYELFLFAGLIIMVIVPLVIYSLRKPGWLETGKRS